MYEEERERTRKGPWTAEEDMQLIRYISLHTEGRWNFLAKAAGLKRSGKSCRLRWVNYLRPDLKRGNITSEEERLIIDLQSRWGNRWSRIAQRLPGRTDNEIKNYWRTRIKKKFHRASNENGSSQHSIYSTCVSNSFLQINNEGEKCSPPHSSLQQNGAPNNNMDYFDEAAYEKFLTSSACSMRIFNGLAKLDDMSSGETEAFCMPSEFQSFAENISSGKYTDVIEKGGVSMFSCVPWPEEI